MILKAFSSFSGELLETAKNIELSQKSLLNPSAPNRGRQEEILTDGG